MDKTKIFKLRVRIRSIMEDQYNDMKEKGIPTGPFEEDVYKFEERLYSELERGMTEEDVSVVYVFGLSIDKSPDEPYQRNVKFSGLLPREFKFELSHPKEASGRRGDRLFEITGKLSGVLPSRRQFEIELSKETISGDISPSLDINMVMFMLGKETTIQVGVEESRYVMHGIE